MNEAFVLDIINFVNMYFGAKSSVMLINAVCACENEFICFSFVLWYGSSEVPHTHAGLCGQILGSKGCCPAS